LHSLTTSGNNSVLFAVYYKEEIAAQPKRF
jgi:hypothetical protein